MGAKKKKMFCQTDIVINQLQNTNLVLQHYKNSSVLNLIFQTQCEKNLTCENVKKL